MILLSLFLSSTLFAKSIILEVYTSTVCLCSPEQILALKEVDKVLKGADQVQKKMIFVDGVAKRSDAQKLFFSMDLENWFFYLDAENSGVKKNNIEQTPTAILWVDGELGYKGSILGKHKGNKEYPFLLAAVKEAKAGKKISIKEGKGIGCALPNLDFKWK